MAVEWGEGGRVVVGAGPLHGARGGHGVHLGRHEQACLQPLYVGQGGGGLGVAVLLFLVC